MTSTILLGLFILVLVAINIALFLMLKKNNGEPKDDIGLKLILEQVNELSRTVDSKVSDLNKTVDLKMGESTRHMSDSVNRQFSESQKLIREITNELAQVKETGNCPIILNSDNIDLLSLILKYIELDK
jgi:hypothetical protein